MKTAASLPGNLQLSPASAEIQVPSFLYDFIKSYLYHLSIKLVQSSSVEVLRIMGKADLTNLKLQTVTVTDAIGTNCYKVSDAFIQATVSHEGHRYEIAMYRERIQGVVFNHIEAMGIDEGARKPNDLLETLKKDSVLNSPYNFAHLQVYRNHDEYDDGEFYLSIVEMPRDSLDEIYLPDAVRKHLELFIHTLENHAAIKRSLRYLLTGPPGTGKTRIIRAIAHECKGKATFIFVDGSERNINRLFEFAGYFSPVVLCIDDLDLMTGSREEQSTKGQLAQFLQRLDGFTDKDFFLLATTNDKALVDVAASRPGRFDLVIDVSIIQPEHYLSLVRNKTQNESILTLFDDEVLKTLHNKRVTGAFIANLVKHLELMFAFAPESVSKEYVLDFIGASYQGFYKSPQPIYGSVGFQLS